MEDIMNFNDLKNHQQEFVNFMADEVVNGTLELNDGIFARTTLNAIARRNGMKVAPAWITTDPSRRAERGSYRVPELVERVAALSPPTA
jgi:hypothetical protein